MKICNIISFFIKYNIFLNQIFYSSSHTSGKGDFNVKIECIIQLHMIGTIEYLV